MILVVFPLLLMAFLKPMFALALTTHGYPGSNGAEQVVPGEAVINGFYIVGMTSFAFFVEYGWNTWDRLRASNATSPEIITGKALPFLAVSASQFLIIFAIGVPLFHLHSRGPLIALVPLVVAFAICLVTLGVMITSLCRTIQQVSASAFGGLVLFGALGGALVPLEVLPGWARAVAPATPTYWVMRGFGSVILDGHSFPAIFLPCLILAGMSLTFAAISLRRFRFTDAKVSF
jgi:ABC-2 type transport system permease protein